MVQTLESVLEKNYPTNYREKEVRDICDFIKLKESFSIIGMKDVGIKNIMRFITFRPEVQQKYLGSSQDYAFVYLNPERTLAFVHNKKGMYKTTHVI